MLRVTLICVGKLKEKHYIAAVGEYVKRLGTLCKFDIVELSEVKLPDSPSEKEISQALEKEAGEIEKNIPAGACVVAMCVEGGQMSSPELACFLEKCAQTGKSRICFVIGGSFGLSGSIKRRAEVRLSMSEMTFPHHLARVMLCEQIYRGFTIIEGTKYHK